MAVRGLFARLIPAFDWLPDCDRGSLPRDLVAGLTTAAVILPKAMAYAALAVMVGLILVPASALRLGFLANFISDPVLTGFKAGIGVVIVVDQVPKLLDIHFHKGGFFENVLAIVRHSPETSLLTLAVAAGTIAMMVLLPRIAPRAPARAARWRDS